MVIKLNLPIVALLPCFYLSSKTGKLFFWYVMAPFYGLVDINGHQNRNFQSPLAALGSQFCPHNILFSDHGTHVVNEIRYMPLIISL